MNPSVTYNFDASEQFPVRAAELASAAVSKGRMIAFQNVYRHANEMGDNVDAYVQLSKQHLNSELREACAARTKIFLGQASWILPLFLVLSLLLAMVSSPFYLGFPEAKTPLAESAKVVLSALFAFFSVFLIFFLASVVRFEIIPAVKDFFAGITKGHLDVLQMKGATLWGIGNKGIHVWGRIAGGGNVRPCKTIHYDMIGEVREFENSQNGYGLMILDRAGHVCCAIDDIGDNEKAVHLLKERADNSQH